MPDTSPYDDLIMEHIKNARNYVVPEGPMQIATGTNLLCGDEMTLYLAVSDQRIRQLAFQCTCCGISMASASIMSELLGGRDIAEVRPQLQNFVAVLLGGDGATAAHATREQQAILDTVRRFPSRARCAALAWATLQGALDQRSETILQP